MPVSLRRGSKKAGLPPGTPIHVGQERTEAVKVWTVGYDEQGFREKGPEVFQGCLSFDDPPAVTWIHVDGIHHVETLQAIGECIGLHPLILEDILNTEQRPKADEFDDALYVVLKLIDYDTESDEIVAEQISLILGPHSVVSFQEKEGPVFDPVRERIRNGKGRIRKMGADYLAYSLLDIVVDRYFIVLEKVGERIELLEEKLVLDPTPETLHVIHRLKTDMIFLRKSIWPLREVIARLERGEAPLIRESTGIYLRDVYDHTIQVIDTIETFRDMISGMLDIYLSSISNRMNAIMKVLTIIATTFIPLTFIAGVYGMNFKYMPELESRWGYPIVLLVMATIGIFMLVYYSRKKWL